MPWKVEDVVKQRIEFVVRAVRKDEWVAELCRQYGISRETGYQLACYAIERFFGKPKRSAKDELILGSLS